MIRRLFLALFVVLIVSGSLYLVIKNREVANLVLTPDLSYSTSLGLLVLIAFGVGLGCGVLLLIFVVLQSSWRERKIKSREDKAVRFVQDLLEIETALNIGEKHRARLLLSDLKRRDPTKIYATILLARIDLALGKIDEARALLDELRATNPTHPLILLLTADVEASHPLLALDALSLLLKEHPFKEGAVRARVLALGLQRNEEALKFHKIVEENSDDTSFDSLMRAEIELDILLKSSKGAHDEALERFAKQYPQLARVHEELAARTLRRGLFEETAHNYLKAAKAKHSLAYYQKAAQVWIRAKAPERALATARSAVREFTGAEQSDALLYNVRLALSLNSLEEATQLLEHCKADAQFPSHLLLERVCLEGALSAKKGDSSTANKLWESALDHVGNPPLS